MAKDKAMPKVYWKGNVEFRHDLFKLKSAQAKKNTSYHSKVVNIVPVEHCHFFHSHTSQGKELTECSPVGGHFHKCEIKVDKSGEMTLEVGEALRKVKKIMPNGKAKTFIERVQFEDMEHGTIVDDHKHESIYLGSEMISPAKIKQITSQNAQFVDSNQKESMNREYKQKAESYDASQAQAQPQVDTTMIQGLDD